MSQNLIIPSFGKYITTNSNNENVIPDFPIISYIEGDGIGVDISPVMKKVVDAAVEKAYGGNKKIAWLELYAGEKAISKYGKDEYLPDETLDMIRKTKVAIKGPLMTPVGGGIRSLNVAIRQSLDLFVCHRPVKYFPGSPSPLKEPWKTNMEIFRENAEGLYVGIEWKAGSELANKLLTFLLKEMKVKTIRFPKNCGIGVKTVSEEGSKRLIRKAIDQAIKTNSSSVTLVHKGNIMKYTEGAFRDWGYEIAKNEFGAREIDKGPWCQFKNPNTGKIIIIKDVIADAFLQQILLKPEEFDIIATMNLNGDYISDALAAQVGGVGISPGANLNEKLAVFEATHGTAPAHAGKNTVNPSSIILSAEMMLRHIGWDDAAELIIKGIKGAIASKRVTYDFARMIPDAYHLSCSGFGDAVIECFER